jgi:hypothetical protein
MRLISKAANIESIQKTITFTMKSSNSQAPLDGEVEPRSRTAYPMQHSIPPTPTTVSYSFQKSIQKHRLADVMETKELVIGTKSPIFLLRSDIKGLVVRKGFESIPALAEHPNASVEIALEVIHDLVFHK